MIIHMDYTQLPQWGRERCGVCRVGVGQMYWNREIKRKRKG